MRGRMNILVTGGAGYKGLKLAEALLERGHRVTVLDNFMYGYDAALFLFRYPLVSFVKKDIRNIEKADVADHDVVFHLAGISGYPACEANAHSAQAINVGGTEKLLSCMDGRQLMVYASTTSIYGQVGTLCTEDTPIQPASLYAITKYEGEKLSCQYSPSVAFRFATIYGVAPKMRWDLMPNDFVMRAVQERSLVLFDSRACDVSPPRRRDCGLPDGARELRPDDRPRLQRRLRAGQPLEASARRGNQKQWTSRSSTRRCRISTSAISSSTSTGSPRWASCRERRCRKASRNSSGCSGSSDPRRLTG